MWKVIARSVFYVLAAVTVTWTASLTYSFILSVLPNMPITAVLSLVVFDVGMLAWLTVFLHYAEGAGQRAVALGGTLFDFAGVALMSVAEIFLGGQTLVAAPEHLGEYALWGVGIWTTANVGLVLVFHLLAPTAQREMALKDAQDAITEQAFQQLKVRTNEIAEQVASKLSTAMVEEAIRELLAGNSMKASQSRVASLYTYNAEAETIPAIKRGTSLLPKVKANRNSRKLEGTAPK